jgi:predicted CopG family antitoxin
MLVIRHSMNKRHTITVNDDIYTRLRNYGRYGDSFSTLIARLLNEIETHVGGKRYN